MTVETPTTPAVPDTAEGIMNAYPSLSTLFYEKKEGASKPSPKQDMTNKPLEITFHGFVVEPNYGDLVCKMIHDNTPYYFKVKGEKFDMLFKNIDRETKELKWELKEGESTHLMLFSNPGGQYPYYLAGSKDYLESRAGSTSSTPEAHVGTPVEAPPVQFVSESTQTPQFDSEAAPVPATAGFPPAA